jgi:hypothetical protein
LFVCVSKNAGFSRKNSPVHGLLMLIYPWFFDTHHSPFIFTSFFNLYITFLYLIFCFVWEIWTNHLEHVYSCQMFHSWNLDVPWKTFVLSKKRLRGQVLFAWKWSVCPWSRSWSQDPSTSGPTVQMLTGP